jgi:hypothetical protein
MSNKKLEVALFAALLVGAAGAHAQTSPIRPAYQFPAPITDAGAASVQVAGSPFYFTPFVGLAAGHDDNLFLSSVNEKSSALYIVSPGFKLDARDGNKVLQLDYQAQIGRYTQSEDDDYVDNVARAQGDFAISQRQFVRLGLDYIRSHDPRGSTDRGIAASPDKYRLISPGAMYVLGAPGAEGRIETYYSNGHKTYLNNRAFTAASDRNTEEFGGAFYWRVMPRTYVLAEIRNTDLRYRQPGSPFSGDERRIYGGVSWEATAATTGTFKVGQLRKRFDSGLPEFSGSSWEALISWAPRTYSRFDFYTSKGANESTGLGNFILTETAGVLWTHSWSSVLSTGVNLRYAKDEYQGFDRTDKTKSLGLKVGYKFRRWLTLGAEYQYTQRDSNTNFFEYDRNLYLLTATGSL